jgi:hypothetical protein
MIYPISDRSSPATEPYHYSKIRLNTIGGEKWQNSGQWLIWNFNAAEDGFYKIALKARQNVINGAISSRRIFIDGVVPFSEMNEVSFSYDSEWQMKTLQDKANSPYMFGTILS